MIGTISAPPQVNGSDLKSLRELIELKSVLDLITDPKALKAALQSIADQSAALEAKLKDLSAKEAKLLSLEKSNAGKESDLQKRDEEVSAKEEALRSKILSVSGQEEALNMRIRSQEKVFSDIKAELDEKLKAVTEKESMVQQKLFEANSLNAAAKVIKDEYTAKVANLKSVVGG